MMDSIHSISNNRPMNLTDLCDDVLFNIFSYLNLNDGIRLSLVCKRFQCFIQENNLPVPTMSSTELEAVKLSSKRPFRYDRMFEKLGPHLKNFTIDSNEDAFEVDLIMKSIGKYCHNIKTMAVRLLYANAVKRLPTSLHNLTVGEFRGKCLNFSALTHLEKLSLSSSAALDEVKVYGPLKEFHLHLQLRDNMPDHVMINRLTTMMVSEKFDVEVHSDYSSAWYFRPYSHIVYTIALNDLNRITNLKIFTMDFFFAVIIGINPTNVRSAKMSCNCGHYAPLSMTTLATILNDYRGSGSAPATKMVRYTPGTSLTIAFGFDNYRHRNKYFKRLRLYLPTCHCASVEGCVLLE